jgi:hypothetical protein
MCNCWPAPASRTASHALCSRSGGAMCVMSTPPIGAPAPCAEGRKVGETWTVDGFAINPMSRGPMPWRPTVQQSSRTRDSRLDSLRTYSYIASLPSGRRCWTSWIGMRLSRRRGRAAGTHAAGGVAVRRGSQANRCFLPRVSQAYLSCPPFMGLNFQKMVFSGNPQMGLPVGRDAYV